MFSNKKKLTAFTVVELTIAMSVSALVLASGHELFKALRNTANRQDRILAQSQEIISAMNIVTDDLLHAVPKPNKDKVVFKGNNFSLDSGEFEIMQFNSLCITDCPANLSGVRQIHKITYEMKKSGESFSLYQTANWLLETNKSPNSNSTKLVLAGIKDVKLSFYDGNEFSTSFTSKENLPVQIKLTFTVNSQTLSRTVTIPCGVSERQ